MPAFSDGQKIMQNEWSRLIQSIPANYTVWKDTSTSPATFRAESLLSGGTDYSDLDLATVIQKAHDTLLNGGCIAVNLIGTEEISKQIEISKDSIAVKGLGWQTNLKLKDNVNDDMFYVTGDYFTIADIALTGNSANQTAGNGIRLNGDLLGMINNCLIDSFWGNGILEEGAQGVTRILANRIVSCGVNGIFLSGVNDESFIMYNDIGGMGYNGILLGSLGNVKIVGNNIFMNGEVGAGGVNLSSSVRCMIANNAFIENYNAQVTITSSGAGTDWGKGNMVIGNEFWGLNSAGHKGIAIESEANRNVIIGNTFNKHDYHIYETGTADYNVYRNNTFENEVGGDLFAFVGAHNNYDGLARTAVSADLSGAATTLITLHAEQSAYLIRATLLYTEASSADAGITLEIGKETDRDYYYTGATETNKAAYYTKEVTLLKHDIAVGDTVTFYSPGAKAGTGEVMLIIDYLTGA